MSVKRIIIFGLLLLPISVFGQQVVNQTVSALKTGQVTSISNNFSKFVDITLNNKSATYSKSQAAVVFKNFYKENHIQSFSQNHRGSQGSNSSVYVIGQLKAKNDTTYRIYLYFKRAKKRLYLQEIRIE